MSDTTTNGVQCPIPKSAYEQIVMGHGSGGKMSAELLQRIFLPAFANPTLNKLEDQATIQVADRALALTTDAFVVRPLFFPGGDIGKLAVNGTVNDLAVGGAQPKCIAASFILEEGLTLEELQRVVSSMGEACRAAGVELVTGDTKVVDRGSGDKMFITTTGLGLVPEGVSLSSANATPGDKIILSGTIGDHGIAVMSVREGLDFETTLESDSAPLAELVQLMLEVCPDIRCMRDPTRGGVASSVNEIADASNVGMHLFEANIPLRREVAGACAILGLDPLYVANEGKLLAVVPADRCESLLDAMHSHPYGQQAACIGEVVRSDSAMVTLVSNSGGERIVPLLAGKQLPRIC